MCDFKWFVSAILLASAVAPGISCGQENKDELNQAQRLVFMGDHLQALSEGQTVVYAFTRRVTNAPDEIDEVRMTVNKVSEDAGRDLSFESLSGPNWIEFPSAQGYRGNPVAIQFMERDIRDMAQATGSSVAYFRNRIRRAFNDPEIQDILVDLDDSELQAVEIVVTPFENDPRVAKTPGYATKAYRFAYSDQVPGHLINIQTRMYDGQGAFLEETLRYKGIVDQ
ncbi:MAG: hypothetical protein WBG92_16405 [Thiohalocapsa sp.]